MRRSRRREALLFVLALALAGLYGTLRTVVPERSVLAFTGPHASTTGAPAYLEPLEQRGPAPAVMLRATQAWEQRSVSEPNVWFGDGRWHMLYTGGWEHAATGYATAPTARGPWTKFAGNPVIGHGHGGWAGDAFEPSLFRDRLGRLFVYFSPGTELPGLAGAGDLMVATGISVPKLRTAPAPALTWGPPRMGIVNVAAIETPTGYRMMFESRVDQPTDQDALWMLGSASGASPLHFRVDEFPVLALQQGRGAFGGPWLTQGHGHFTLLYHASRQGSLGTDIYRATSPDLHSWALDPEPLVTRRPLVEVDQVADPFAVIEQGHRLLFTSAMNNSKKTGLIVVRDLGRGRF